MTAEKFMYGFVLAPKTHTSLAFKERLRGIDVLIIDDVQFLQGKSIQQKFCHTINALIDARKQIIIAADRPPADLSLEERVRSRLSGGVCVEIGRRGPRRTPANQSVLMPVRTRHYIFKAAGDNLDG